MHDNWLSSVLTWQRKYTVCHVECRQLIQIKNRITAHKKRQNATEERREILLTVGNNFCCCCCCCVVSLLFAMLVANENSNEMRNERYEIVKLFKLQNLQKWSRLSLW